MCQREVSPLAEHDVEVEVFRQPLVELDAGIVETDTLRCEIVRPDDGCIAPGATGPDVTLVDDGHVRDAVIPRQIVGAGQPMGAATDDDDVIVVLQRPVVPHP